MKTKVAAEDIMMLLLNKWICLSIRFYLAICVFYFCLYANDEQEHMGTVILGGRI